MARGGGKLADIVTAGQAMDLTDKISADAKTALGSSLSAFEIDAISARAAPSKRTCARSAPRSINRWVSSREMRPIGIGVRCRRSEG